MKDLASYLLLALMLIGLSFGGPVVAQEVDWDQVKKTWNSLTPEEQDTYRQMMPARRSSSSRGTATLFEPLYRTPADRCEDATNECVAFPISDSGNTDALANDYDIAGIGGACDTGFGSAGNDIAYLVRTDITCDVTVSLDGDFDEVLYVVTDCGDLAAGCVGADDSGSPETVSFTATAGTDYFVIVDGWSGDPSGNYTLDITEGTSTGCVCVPVELQRFTID